MTHEEYRKLEKTIDEHMDRYYNQDAPTISDYEYDQLMLQLKAAEKEHPEWITPESPTQKIGGTAKREAGVKVTHDVPMLSIEDLFTKEDVTDWVDKVQQMHPEAKVRMSKPGISTSSESIDSSPNSFSMSATFSAQRPSAISLLMKVVLPAPRKPPMMSILTSSISSPFVSRL